MKLTNIWMRWIVKTTTEIRKEIEGLVKQYAQIEFKEKKFERGKTCLL